ncbi:EAL domain-containing protein [Clostridium sp. CCUG 7971]|uniref:EAL domain-containing protein n=1 Tax=Clostridium sp. CCUG 7971 TaxID=2811414 RepID=UPI001ABAA877|nr:EAL domain-containing protein [Clostridium sp. CCUG 7971]MBO3444620.1 EAL domain-containing protein [Clostridium sp. CCUG 7971]
MEKIFKARFILILFSLFCILNIKSYADSDINNNEEILKVGFYDNKPYYFMNKKGKEDGYYHDLLNLLIKGTGIKYKYIKYDFSEAVNKLENGEIDLLFGLHRTDERMKKVIYTNNYIEIETYRIYTNKDIRYGKLDELEGLKFGLVKNGMNSNWIFEFLENKDINIIPVWVDTDKDSIKLLKNKSVGAIVGSAENNDLDGYKNIYEFSVGPVYIAGNKHKGSIIKELDNRIDYIDVLEKKHIEKIYRDYFNEATNLDKKKITIIISIIFLLIISTCVLVIKSMCPKIKKNKIKSSIRNRIKNKEYLLYYQPIVDPKKDSIVGFEALLRLNHPKEGILTPYKFIDEIEKNDMLSEMSIWVLKQVLLDYNKIKKYNNIDNKKFYISMNLTIKEIENDDFIYKIQEILNIYRMEKNSICLEIVESVRISNLEKLQKAIQTLKNFGFMIAIDDFGVEYSNLDILEKLDFDIIKLDKYFVDDISESIVRQRIMKFISDITIIKNKSLVAEGVEDILQKEIIKNIENNKFFIQGYFYSKPISIEDIKNINIKSC